MNAREMSKKIMRTALSVSLVGVLSLYPMSLERASAEEDEEININLSSDKDIDVVLTIGKTVVNVENFGNDLRAKLVELGINPERVNISAMETSSQNLQSTFAWTQHVYNHVGSISIQNNGSRIQMYGNPSNPGFNKILTPNNQDPDIKEQTMSFDFSLDYGDSFDSGGVLLNTHLNENGLMDGYALAFPNGRQATLYKLKNWSSSSGEEIWSGGWGASGTINPKATLVGTINMGQSGSFKLKMEKNKLTVMNRNTGAEIGNLPLDEHFGWGFGFFSDHYSHGCSRIGQFALTNVDLNILKAKEFKDVIKEPKWRNQSERFLLNIDDTVVDEFSDSYGLGEILPRLINEDVSYVGLGTPTNKSQMESFVAKNNDKGTVLSNQNYNQMITDAATYIFSQLKLKSGRGQYVLLDERLEVSVTPESLKTNSQTPEFPSGRWRLDHEYDFFDNPMGESPTSGFYQQNLQLNFDKVGKYNLSFGDQSPIPSNIFVHREPVAAYSSDLVKNGSEFKLLTQDYSYDLDKMSQSDKGIKVRTWKWKKTTDEKWNTGKPSVLPPNGDYLVQYQVEDYQGQVSRPSVRYFTTTNRSARPIANFTVTPNHVSIYDTVTHSNTSYDPAGKEIIAYEWTFFKDNIQFYKGAQFQEDFISRGSGNYRISLKAKNSDNLWSEEFVRNVTVSKDEVFPTVIADLTSHKWTKNQITVQMLFDDKGGSGFKHQRVAVSQSMVKPLSGWSEYSSAKTRTQLVDDEGNNYIHIEALDMAGNVLNKVLGPYQIDRSLPTGADFTFDGTNPSEGLTINVIGKDDVSGIKKIIHPNLAETIGDTARHVVTNPGEYRFRIIDAVGNEKVVATTVSSPNFSIEEDGLNLRVKIDKKYSGIGLVQDTNTGEIKNGNDVLFPINGNGHYAYRVNDGGIWSDQKIYQVKNYHELLAPRIKLEYDTNWTNKSISVQVTAYSNSKKGISHLVLPDGTQVSGTSSSYVIHQNGVYTFYAVDNDGTFGYQSIQVKNIDKRIPDITLIAPEDWTNKDVLIEFTDNEKETGL